jgi:hypothetical protein
MLIVGSHHGRGSTKTIAGLCAFLSMRLCFQILIVIAAILDRAMNRSSIEAKRTGLFFRQFLRLIKMPKWLMLRLKMYAALQFCHKPEKVDVLIHSVPTGPWPGGSLCKTINKGQTA